jgi:hypothetical protein
MPTVILLATVVVYMDHDIFVMVSDLTRMDSFKNLSGLSNLCNLVYAISVIKFMFDIKIQTMKVEKLNLKKVDITFSFMTGIYLNFKFDLFNLI